MLREKYKPKPPEAFLAERAAGEREARAFPLGDKRKWYLSPQEALSNQCQIQ
jgi:hypothetical protein